MSSDPSETAERDGTARRGLLIYDGDCGFCTRSVRLLRTWCTPDIDIEPWQFADLPRHRISERQAGLAVQWVGPDGSRAAGAPAIARALGHARAPWPAVGALLRLPPFSVLAAAAYRTIARNRYRLPGSTPACALPADRRP